MRNGNRININLKAAATAGICILIIILSMVFAHAEVADGELVLSDVKVYVDNQLLREQNPIFEDQEVGFNVIEFNQKDVDETGGVIEYMVIPGAKIDFDIQLQNTFEDDTKIENIDIALTIPKLDRKTGGRIEVKQEDYRLRGKETSTITLTLELPDDINAGTYDLNLKITGRPDAPGRERYEIEVPFTLKVSKYRYDIRYVQKELDKRIYQCGDEAELDLTLVNRGHDGADVKLSVMSLLLQLDRESDFHLAEDQHLNENSYTENIEFRIPSTVESGIYEIEFKANYYAYFSEDDKIQLEVICEEQQADTTEARKDEEKSGELSKDEQPEEQENDEREEEQDEQEGSQTIVVTEDPDWNEGNAEDDAQLATLASEPKRKVDMKKTILAIAIGNVVIVILLAMLIGYMYLSRKQDEEKEDDEEFEFYN